MCGFIDLLTKRNYFDLIIKAIRHTNLVLIT